MTSDTFRTLALEIPGAAENAHMNHPDFRVARKVFASLGYPDKSWAMVKLTPDLQRSLVRKAPKVFRPCNGAWGKKGSTNVHLASAKTAEVRLALKAAVTSIVAAKRAEPPSATGAARA